MSHAALNSLSPASATIEDITDQVGDTDLVRLAAEFVASINAQAGATSSVGLTPATPPLQMAATPMLSAKVPKPVPEAAVPCVGHAHLQQLLREMEQRQLWWHSKKSKMDWRPKYLLRNSTIGAAH